MGNLSRRKPEVKKGYPPERSPRQYDSKLEDGALLDVAEKIKPGHYISDVSRGSAGKLAKRVRCRDGLDVIRETIPGGTRENVYVVTKQWLSEHPNVGYSRK